MAKLLLAREVTAAMVSRLREQVQSLSQAGVVPSLAIIRCGEKAADLTYERGALKRAEEIGIGISRIVLPENVEKQRLLGEIDRLNRDASVHGVLLFRPLPQHLLPFEEEICNRLTADKDVDAMTNLSYAGVFTGKQLGFAPCTAEACIAILRHYGIDCRGKRAVVIGRSLVVGKPMAMLLMKENATVTVCHTKSVDIAGICRQADIIVTAAGCLGSLTDAFVRPGQVVVDVSMNWDPNKVTKNGIGGMVGDAVFSQVEPIVEAITPVPGGVGGVTSMVLMSHVVEAAQRLTAK